MEPDEDPNVDHDLRRDSDDIPEQGSPGESQKDGESVPMHRFLAALKSATDKTGALEQEVRELKAAQAKQPEAREPTRAELLKAVSDNLISQEQADAVWEQQIVKRATDAALKGATQSTKVSALEAKVNEQLTSYRELVPEAWMDGTDQRKKVQTEYQHLVSVGLPATTATEAAAMRAAFGDIAALKLAKSAKPGAKESHQDVGGGKPADGKQAAGGDPVKGLSERQRDFYSHGIKSGRYADWNAVREELKFAKPSARSARG